jgi:hypothetical protein
LAVQFYVVNASCEGVKRWGHGGGQAG